MSISVDRRRQAFDQSVTFQRFLDQAGHFVSDYHDSYAHAVLDQDDRAAIAGIAGPIDVLAIVEDWCPDVVANLPIVARLAEATDQLRLHVLIRDDATRDVADAYPYEGRSHIPTYVFSDAAGVELGVIVERTAPIQERVDVFLAQFFSAHPELDRSTFPSGIADAVKAELTESALQLRRDLRELERKSLIAAIGALAPSRAAVPVLT